MPNPARASDADGRRIAVPVTAGRLAPHFGHCESFAIFTCDVEGARIEKTDVVSAPPHSPGLLPAWLGERGVSVVIAGGLGRRARELFDRSGIEVVVGAGVGEPREIVLSYLEGTLTVGPNVCDH
jgi:predicted Fe-Mo cluster-binding NifX family protein